ncbi:hypothetical protein, partial [Candidatus Kryptobacter tengchongensis]
ANVAVSMKRTESRAETNALDILSSLICLLKISTRSFPVTIDEIFKTIRANEVVFIPPHLPLQ